MWFIVPTQLFLASKLPLKNRCKALSSPSVSGTWKWPSSVHWRCWLAFQCCRWLLGIAWISGKPKKKHETTGEVKPMFEVKRKLYVDKRNHRYRNITSWHHLCSTVCEVHNVYHAYPAVLLAGELTTWLPFSSLYKFVNIRHTWVFPKIGVPPKSSISIGCSIKPSILGYHHLRKHPHISMVPELSCLNLLKLPGLGLGASNLAGLVALNATVPAVKRATYVGFATCSLVG